MKNQILSLLLNKPNTYTINELSMILELSDDKLNKQIEQLVRHGYHIVFNPYGFIKSFPENEREEEISNSEVRYKKHQLMEYISEQIQYNGSITMSYLCQTDELKQVIEEMADEGYLRIDDGNIHITENIIDNISDEDLFRLLVMLNIMRKYHHYGIVLKDIFHKAIAKYVERGYKFDPKVVVFGQGTSFHVLSTETAVKISEAINKNKRIEFVYSSAMDDEKFNIIPWLLIYSGINQSWYVVDIDEKIFEINNIVGSINIKEHHLESFGDSGSYIEALIVSKKEIVKINIKFDKEDFIKKKLIRYVYDRKQSELKENDDFYILTDSLRGIGEVEQYIKSFGDSVNDIEPAELRDKVLKDYTTLLERYGELDE